jgi:hypothetical protein
VRNDLNLYDTRIIRCVRCQKCLGELDYDAEVMRPLCGQCANPLPENDDKIMYTINNIKNNKHNPIIMET